MIARLKNANKIYETQAGKFTALANCNLELYEGELLLIIGPSGSGKTTLLSLLGCLINPTEGTLEIDGKNVDDLPDKEMAKVRLDTIGFVFQQFNLLAPLTAAENVAFPLKMRNMKTAEIKQKTEEALKKVNISEHKHKLPKQLSGGQQQRVAIARALVTDPKIILCDEPTASLDKHSLEIVMKELKELAEGGKAVAVVTHDPRLMEYADRVIEVENGIVNEVNKQTIN
ncbi:ABC transporter ATP-binding protein [Limibacter armeniacum]|uniref:ABC transporter ATP-binding protein n=1 Tax=Limibacter armeniacum TaxID=466084 RepID=UPI0038CC1E40